MLFSFLSPFTLSLPHYRAIEHELLARVQVSALTDAFRSHAHWWPDVLPVFEIAAALELGPLVDCAGEIQSPGTRGGLRGTRKPRRPVTVELVSTDVPRHN